VRTALETRIGIDMKDYKEYIDNEMMVTMAQMDKPSRILDYLYLVSNDICLWSNPIYCCFKHSLSFICLFHPKRVQNGMLPTMKNYIRTSIQIKLKYDYNFF